MIRIKKKYNESYYITIFLILFAVFVTVIEAFLIHKTQEYFGGGALNRPFSLSTLPQYIAYFTGSLASDLFFYGLVYFILLTLVRKLRLVVLQQHFVIVSFLMLLLVLILSAKWSLFQYFSNRFDWGLLSELTGGNAINILTQFDSSILLWLLVVIVLFLVYLYFVKLLGRVEMNYTPWRPQKFILVSALLFLVLLSSMHFYLVNSDSLRFGLSNKTSYWVTDQTLSIVSDVDFDGYSPLTFPKDSDNFNSHVNPLSREIPENGIDENGLMGDLVLGEHKKNVRPSFDAPGKNVIMIVIETFRADILHAKIGGELVMPFLSSIADKHAYTLSHFSNYGVTARAIQTLLSGRLDYNEQSEFLFKEFDNIGYQTFAVSAQNESWGGTDSITGMKKTDYFYDSRNIDWTNRKMTAWEKLHEHGRYSSGEEINRIVSKVLDSKKNKTPFFMYLNYQELHYPYYKKYHPLKFVNKGRTNSSFFKPENKSDIWLQYANAANYLDAVLKELFNMLEDKRLLDESVIIISGDHPDSFYENKVLGHAWTLDEYQRRTPLVVVNGLGVFNTPIGQDEIRNLIIESVKKSKNSQPLVFREKKDKKIFVISGVLEKPRQIGLINDEGLDRYDFKSDVFYFKFGRNMRLSEISNPQDILLAKSVINLWEFERYNKFSNSEL